MKKTLEEKLQMCKEHVEEGKSLSHICELHNSKNLDDLKYLVNLYKRYGEDPFLKRERNIYRKDTKLLAIKMDCQHFFGQIKCGLTYIELG